MTVAVLFDLEDTLVQTPWADQEHVIEFRRKAKEKLIELGIPPSVLEGTERATIMRNKASGYIEQNFSQTETERFRLEMEKFLTKYELDSARKSKLFPDTNPTLEALRKLGIKMGLITNTSAKAVSVIFQVHGLKKYFDVVVTRERVKKLKPDPEGILLAVKELSVKRFFMVGDLVLDAVAAKSAKGKVILVNRHSEQFDPQDLFKSLPAKILKKAEESFGRSDLQPDYVVQSLSEVPAIVKTETRRT